jgi:hypothetical protein
LLSDQILPLAVRPPRVLLLDRRDRDHAAMAHPAAQPAENGAHQEFRIEAIGLRASVFARHRDAGGMDDISSTSRARSQRANQKPPRPVS